jgi:hypothetical protein
VKTRKVPYLPPICMLLFACSPTASRGPTDAITFDTAKRLDDFVFLPRATAGRTDGWSLIATLVEDWRRSPLIQMKIAWRLRFTVPSPDASRRGSRDQCRLPSHRKSQHPLRRLE